MFQMARNGEQFCALSKTENLAFCYMYLIVKGMV